MKLGTFTQSTRSRTPYTINYSASLSDGDYILPTGLQLVSSPPGLIFSQITIFDNVRARFFVSGGVDRTTYTVEAIGTTADGEVFDDEITYKIKD